MYCFQHYNNIQICLEYVNTQAPYMYFHNLSDFCWNCTERCSCYCIHPMYSLFLIFNFLQQPPLWQWFIFFYRKPRDTCASWFRNCLYGWSIFSICKVNVLPECAVYCLWSRNWTCNTTCFYHHAALSKVVHHVYGWPFSLKRHKACFLEALHKSIFHWMLPDNHK